jgi:hypothetical protein
MQCECAPTAQSKRERGRNKGARSGCNASVPPLKSRDGRHHEQQASNSTINYRWPPFRLGTKTVHSRSPSPSLTFKMRKLWQL